MPIKHRQRNIETNKKADIQTNRKKTGGKSLKVSVNYLREEVSGQKCMTDLLSVQKFPAYLYCICLSIPQIFT